MFQNHLLVIKHLYSKTIINYFLDKVNQIQFFFLTCLQDLCTKEKYPESWMQRKLVPSILKD